MLVVLACAAIVVRADDVEEKAKVEKRGIYGGYSGVGGVGAYDPSFAAGGAGYLGGVGLNAGYGLAAGGLNGGYTSGYNAGYYPKAVSKVSYTIGHGGNLGIPRSWVEAHHIKYTVTHTMDGFPGRTKTDSNSRSDDDNDDDG